MSLRTFHIVFVTIATLLFAFLALWAFRISTDRSDLVTTIGVLGCIGTLGMPVYGVCFYKKIRKIIL
jgi:multidrug transporter EmrE-like cation transporter